MHLKKNPPIAILSRDLLLPNCPRNERELIKFINENDKCASGFAVSELPK